MRDILGEDGASMQDQPHGWIQWKGTDVCIDLYCACGAHLHFDGTFLYHWICPHCQRHYESGSHVRMYEMTAEEIAESKRQGFAFKHPDPDAERAQREKEHEDHVW